MIRFYNPGPAFSEKMRFDHPTNDPKYLNNISFWIVNAEKESFFDCPTVVDVDSLQGTVQIAVQFADRLHKEFREFGIIRIDPKRDPETINPSEQIATNEKDAKSLGKAVWEDYMLQLAREHIETVERARNVGVIPARAMGLKAHALKVLGMQDPADAAGNLAKTNKDVPALEAIMAQMAEMARTIKKLQGAA